MNQQPAIGRIIHAVIHDGRNNLVTRPGIIVRTWGEGTTTVQAQVFTDGNYDPNTNDGLPNVVWKSSLTYDETGERFNSWHWPPGA